MKRDRSKPYDAIHGVSVEARPIAGPDSWRSMFPLPPLAAKTPLGRRGRVTDIAPVGCSWHRTFRRTLTAAARGGNILIRSSPERGVFQISDRSFQIDF